MPRSGLLGVVNGANTVRNVSINETNDAKAYGTSNTKQGEGQRGGNKDWTGSYQFYGHTPPNMPGDSFTLTAYDGSRVATGTAIVTSIELTCDIENGEIIASTVNFGGDGALSWTTGSASDVTTPDPPTSLDGQILDNLTEIPDVRTYTFTITCDVKAYSSSSTNGWMKRVAGRISANGSFGIYVDELTTMPQNKTFLDLKLYVTPTTFWHFRWALITSVEPEIDIEGAEIESADINWSFSGYKDATGGYIKKPDGTTWWPAA